MTQTLIEKLEALPRYDYESRGYMGFNVWQATPDGKGEYIRTKDLRAIIEQHKSEAPLQETIRAQQAEIERLKGQRTELIRELKWTVAGLDDYYYDHAAEQVEATRALIAEIEAGK